MILDARSDADFVTARALFEEYAAAVPGNLCFQDFAHELEHLREVYAPPRGCLLLARRSADVEGCVALRPLQDDVCEMKRLYVKPAARGAQLGRHLTVAVIERAREAGYRRLVLDTLPSMVAAQHLYRSLGFRDATPYSRTPSDGVVYMELSLT